MRDKIYNGVSAIRNILSQSYSISKIHSNYLDIENYYTKILKSTKYNVLLNLSNKHFLICGGSGFGIGGHLSILISKIIDKSGSITIVSRDPKNSEYKVMLDIFFKKNISSNCKMINLVSDGLLDSSTKNINPKIINFFKHNSIKSVVYINTIANAYPVTLNKDDILKVKDYDSDGLFYWNIKYKDNIKNSSIMGTQSIEVINHLKSNGITTNTNVFTDWHGSLDILSRITNSNTYGRQAIYSSSLCIPKEEVRRYISNDNSNNNILIFLPSMLTNAMRIMPGGVLIYLIYNYILKRHNINRQPIKNIALDYLKIIYKKIFNLNSSEIFHLDYQESLYTHEFYHIYNNINNDTNSNFFYKNYL